MLDDLDAIDRKLLDLLQQDGRMSNADLARAVRMAPSAVFERVRRLERDGVIRGYGAALDPRAIERSLLAFIILRTDATAGDTLAGDQPPKLPEVLEVHHVAGQDSYLVKARVKDPEALGKLLRERFGAIPGVRSTMSTIALETFKEHWALPIEPLPIPEKEKLRA